MTMYCTRCGLERSRPNTAADTGACTCGNSAWCSWRPAPFAWPPSISGGTPGELHVAPS